MRRAGLLLALALVLGGAALPALAAARERFDTRVLALVGRPGYPALPHVVGDRVYEGTYDNPRGDREPSRVFEYASEGTLLRSWTIRGQDLSKPHGIQVVATDALGRLVLLDKAPGRALLLDRRTGDQLEYATFADLPLCTTAAPGTPCSPAQRDQPPMANYGEWGPDGSLYVTDYQQAVLWRVPPGGGAAQVWLADPRLDGVQFGTSGIALTADRSTLLVTQASSGGGADGDPTTGKLYAVPIGPDGRPGPLRTLWESASGDLPDGFALSSTGRIYIALVGTSAQLAVLDPAGREVERFPKEAGSGENGSSVPFDSPSGVAFLGTRLIVANQSFTAGDPAHQALLDVETGETGLPELVPPNAGLRAGETVPTAPAEPEPPFPTLSSRRLRPTRTGRVALGVRCLKVTERCTGSVTLAAPGSRRRSTVRFAVEPGRVTTVRPRLPAGSRRLLARRGRLRGTVTAVARTGAGFETTRRLRITLRR